MNRQQVVLFILLWIIWMVSGIIIMRSLGIDDPLTGAIMFIPIGFTITSIGVGFILECE